MLVRIMSAHLGLIRDEKGATAIEYGLIAALVAVVIITAVELMGGTLSGTFTTVNSELAGAP
jgi:pilus assembly protein Flp/PilA